VGDQYSYFCRLDAEGEIVKRGRVPSPQAGLKKMFGKIATGESPWRPGQLGQAVIQPDGS